VLALRESLWLVRPCAVQFWNFASNAKEFLFPQWKAEFQDNPGGAGTATYPRMYHSVALLLPNATVATAGSNPQRTVWDNHIEIYSPAYLWLDQDHRSDVWRVGGMHCELGAVGDLRLDVVRACHTINDRPRCEPRFGHPRL
jgi:hypothetical protein